VLLAISVRTLVLVVLAGLNVEAVTPLGTLEAESVTLPLKPYCGVTVMVLVPLLFFFSDSGTAERAKSGTRAGLTVSVKLCVAAEPTPFEAVNVIG